MTVEDIAEEYTFSTKEQENKERPQIKVFGVGGGGCNTVAYMYSNGYKDVTFAVANTDRQALKAITVPTQILLGPVRCKGNGSGGDPEVAREAAEESADAIRKILQDDTKVVFITAGMGGGTGTGASPVVARIAREAGILTIGIVTIPFLFEGSEKIKSAFDGARELSKAVDVLLIVNNERLLEVYPNLTFSESFHKADEALCDAAQSISGLIASTGKINRDLEDVVATLKDGRTAIIATGEASGEDRIKDAFDNALNSPLMENTNIYTARRVLMCLHASEKSLLTGELNIFRDIMSDFNPERKLSFGLYYDESLGDRVKISLLASGFQYIRPIAATSDNEGAADIDDDEMIKMLMEIYYPDSYNKSSSKAGRYFILSPEQLDDESVLKTLETNPAYNRDRKTVEKFHAGAGSGMGNA